MDYKRSFQHIRKLLDTPGISTKQPKPIKPTPPPPPPPVVEEKVEEKPIVEETPNQEETKSIFNKTKNKWIKK